MNYLIVILELKDQYRVKFMYYPEYHALQLIQSDVIKSFGNEKPIFANIDRDILINNIKKKYQYKEIEYGINIIDHLKAYTWAELMLVYI
jgi:hypothetical protein